MQDRFKSRFFHKPSGKYLNSQSLVYCNGCYEQVADRQLPNGTYKAYILTTYNTSEIIEEQCVGLKDKNSKLIYENDFIQAENGNIYLIEWCQEKLGFVARTNNSDDVLESLDISRCEWGVVGNIHETHNLLENKDESV